MIQLFLALLIFSASHAHAQREGLTATYQVQVLGSTPARMAVRATLPSDGALLTMAKSRPGNVPELADAGWPALIQRLRVTDASGQPVGLMGAGAAGWTLARSVSGPLKLEYEVDYAPLAARGWPAPREAAFSDSDHLIAIGRSLFIMTPLQRTSDVRFLLPRGWQAVTPWPMRHGGGRGASIASTTEMTENMIVFMRGEPEAFAAGGFRLKVVTLGHWRPARAEVRRVIAAALQRLVAWIGFDGHADYLVVLLPQVERGGESFCTSFAMTLDAAPSRANVPDWGNTIAHELFHYWNGGLLKGEDYPSSQWFQEGFTEHAANLALISAGLIRPDEYYAKLAAHVTKYRMLETPLDAPGTRKGPPLYSGGALVAFTMEGMIREATRNERGVGDVLRALLRNTQGGDRPYGWPDIRTALESVAPGPWAEFHRRHIQGDEPLPLTEAFLRVGLRLSDGNDRTIGIEPDSSASEFAHLSRRVLMGGRRDP